MSLPAWVGTGLIVGSFASWVMDGSDPDDRPDQVPIVGLQVSITPSVSGRFIYNKEDGNLVTIESLRAVTNEEGVLGYYETPGDLSTWRTGIRAVSPQDEGLDPSGWTYRIRIRSASNAVLAEYSITFAPDEIVDLATVTPVPPSPGTAVAEWVRVRGEVKAEADRVLNEMAAQVTDLGDVLGVVSVTQAQSRSSVLSATLTGDTTFVFEPGLPGLSYTCTLLLSGEYELSLPGVYAAYGVPLVLSGADLVHVMWAGDRWIALSGAAALAVPGGWA